MAGKIQRQPINGYRVTPMREVRLRAGLSQVELAHLTGLSRLTIIRLESRPPTTDGPTVVTQRIVATALGCSVQDLWPSDNGKRARRRK